jgi:uncharacterized integral membrane protein (TIGR00698 family)
MASEGQARDPTWSGRFDHASGRFDVRCRFGDATAGRLVAVLDTLRDRLPARAERMRQGISQSVMALAPGILVTILLAFVAGWIARQLGEPLSRNPVLVAMMFGLLIGNCITVPDRIRPGLDFTKRYLLRLAVILVGFRVTVQLLMDLGVAPMAVAALELVAVLVLLNWIARRVFGLDRELSLLIAGGSAICGAAAILSLAALTRARDQHAGIAVSLITVAGTVALLIYPVAYMAGWLPGLDHRFYGVFVGASIYELAQVYGAAFAVSDVALETATQVKLGKVLLLVPLLMVLGMMRRRSDAAASTTPVPFPWFIVAFAGVMLLNSSITIEPAARNAILLFDQFLFMMVMIALGLTTRLSMLREAGGAARILGTGVVGLILSTAIAYALVAAIAAR